MIVVAFCSVFFLYLFLWWSELNVLAQRCWNSVV